ncbi:Fic family protein [Pleurocapsales cyanobacterium LEGE 06147]|nr:Fic family protein [Pleurocapsales cyanobacterium LEGE 06147]
MLQKSLEIVSDGNACQLYDRFLAGLIRLHQQQINPDLSQLLVRYLNMSNQSQFQQIDKLKGWLDSFRPLSPIIVAELKKLYDVQFTYNSNAIEGNTLTQSETELVLSKGITIGGKTLEEHLEVIGHKDAIDYVETLAQQDKAIGEWEIKQIHNLILRKIAPEEAGRYRQLDVKAAGTNYLYPAHYLLPQLMTEFIAWLNSQQIQTLHPIKYATFAHYRFVSIHPFRDGNGRTSRLLINLLLLRAGYPIVIISNSKRNDYINAIAYGQQNQDDTNRLLTLVLDAAKDSLVETLRLVSTATDSRGKGMPFYEEMITLLNS